MGEGKNALSAELLQVGETEEGDQTMSYEELVRQEYEIGIVEDGLLKAKEKIKDAVVALEGASDFSEECGLMVKDFEQKLKNIGLMLGELYTKAVFVEDSITRLEKEGLANV